MIRLLLADVDGTLVTPDKELTERATAAVHALREEGILFAITSGRPPRGMSMLVEPLALETPIAAFNGGVIVDPEMNVLEEHTVPEGLVPRVVELLGSAGLDVWLYRGADWLVRDSGAPHVDRESRTVRFDPTVVESFEGKQSGIAKVVGVSDDREAVDAAAAKVRDELGDEVTAALSQPYYVDVTHPEANKAAVARFLSRRYEIPAHEMATIGDMPNDVLMFAYSGLSIAMGNADREVQRAARRVTASNEDDGFAKAVERFILRRRSE